MSVAENLPEQEPPIIELPDSRRSASSMLSDATRWLLDREKHLAIYNRRIVKLKQRTTELERERDHLAALDLEQSIHLARALSIWALESWNELVEKGTRLIRLAAGQIRRRHVPKAVRIKNDNFKAFHAEARRKRMASKLITWEASANLDPLRDDLELAATFTTIVIVEDEKIEIRPNQGANWIQASIVPDMLKSTWELMKFKKEDTISD